MKCRFCNNTAQNCNIEYTKQSKTNKNKINHLPNPPQGGDEGGENFEKKESLDAGRYDEPATIEQWATTPSVVIN